jgi:RNA polymerase sigma factor (sigma-70 family)
VLTGSQHEASQDVAALVRDAQAGDEGALNHLVATHLPLIYNILGRALHTPADVDDLVQETMLRVVRGLPSLREPDRFRSWAVAIAYRQLQQHARRRAIDVPHRFDVLDVPDPSTDFAERSVAEIVLTGQRRDLVRAARWLDPADRQLLALWWQEVAGDLSRAEVAAALSLDAPHTAVRLQRMKTRLEEARAVVGALDAAPRCPGLAVLAQGWDGDTTSVWRKRFTRHTRDCPTCGDHRSGLVPPERLLPGLGVLIVPHGLLDSLPGATTSPVHAALGRVGDVAQQLAARPVATGAGAAALAGAVTITCVLVPWSAPAPLGRPPAAGTTAGTTAGPSGDPPASATGTPSASAAPRSSASDPAPSPAAALPDGASRRRTSSWPRAAPTPATAASPARTRRSARRCPSYGRDRRSRCAAARTG